MSTSYWTPEALGKEISELEAELAHKRLLLEQAEEQEALRQDELRRRTVVPVAEGVTDSVSSGYLTR